MSRNRSGDSEDGPRHGLDSDRHDDVDSDRHDDHSVDSARHDDTDHHDDTNYNSVHHDDTDYDSDRHDDTVDADRHEDHGPNRNEGGKWLSALIAILGVWMIGQAFGVELTDAQFWNDVLVGALLIGVGAYNYSRRAGERFGNAAVALIAVLAGVWLIAAPFVLGADSGLTETTNVFGFYNDIVVGLLAIGLGAMSAFKARGHEEETPRTTT
jgi:hypothetical protein